MQVPAQQGRCLVRGGVSGARGARQPGVRRKRKEKKPFSHRNVSAVRPSNWSFALACLGPSAPFPLFPPEYLPRYLNRLRGKRFNRETGQGKGSAVGDPFPGLYQDGPRASMGPNGMPREPLEREVTPHPMEIFLTVLRPWSLLIVPATWFPCANVPSR